MEILRKKNVATEIVFPMVSSASPDSFVTGESVTDDAYYNDGGGWSALGIADTVAEIGSTGLYEISLSQAEMNHDQIIIKLTSTNAADSAIVINTFNDLSASDVNAEVVDALATDTYNEPGQEAPGVNVSLSTKIGYLYKSLRNKKTASNTTVTVFNDDGTTPGQTRTVSDDGSTYTEGELGSGA